MENSIKKSVDTFVKDLKVRMNTNDVIVVQKIFLKNLSLKNEFSMEIDRVFSFIEKAAYCDSLKIFELLIDFLTCFDDNEKNFIKAIFKGDAQSVEQLLRSGVGIKILSEEKMNTLAWLSFRQRAPNRKEVLNLLLEYDQLDLSYLDEMGQNHLHLFVSNIIVLDSYFETLLNLPKFLLISEFQLMILTTRDILHFTIQSTSTQTLK